ncbi:MAG: prolyl oligopeptidase family serine peptidase [Lachnospiraceae bacterium]|nr:prolyl oligopeptidase family serine peptidase [Lachnospiraceae bacterium]
MSGKGFLAAGIVLIIVITAAVFIKNRPVEETKETGQETVTGTEAEAEQEAVTSEEPVAEADPVTEEKPETEESSAAEEEDVPELENVSEEGDGRFTFSFDGLEHDMIIDLPEKPEGAPVIIMLHGQGNTAESFRSTVHLEEDANPRGYAVAYLTAAADPDNPAYGIGWNSGLREGRNRDVELIKAVVNYLQSVYGFDENRIFAAGFSNGAFMIHRLAMEAGDRFCAVVSCAGFMTEYVWNEKNEKNDTGFFQITGQKDDVVPKYSDGKNSDGSVKNKKAPAIEDVVDYWAASNGLTQKEETKIGKKDSTLTKYTGGDGRKQVWNLFVIDGYHSWYEEKLTGIDTNELVLDFFDACSK